MRIKLIFFCALLVSAGFFVYNRMNQDKKEEKRTFPITKHKSFVIILPSYNNSPYVEKNLRSVFSQNYENYRLVYIDDHSSDDTLAKARSLIEELQPKNSTTIIENPANYGTLANIYNAVQTCQDHEIIVLLDGDDSLAHEEVLNILDRAYADPEVWVTYGHSLNYPSYKESPIPSKEFLKSSRKNRDFRKSPCSLEPLRTFYASLFKKIKLEDLYFRGQFFPMASHYAIMLPLLEMAGPHSLYISDCLYLSNTKNPIRDETINPEFQQTCIDAICKKNPFLPLEKLPRHIHTNEGADFLIFSKDNPLQLYALLESAQQFVHNINKTTVLYQTSSHPYEAAYLQLKLSFPKVEFVKYTPEDSFKTLLTKLIFDTTPPESRFIVFAKDSLLLKKVTDLEKGIQALEQTGAYGLFLGHHTNLKFCAELNRHEPIPLSCPLPGIDKDQIPYAWQFSSGIDDWSSPNSIDFTLYKKTNLKKDFLSMEYDSLSSLLFEWGPKTPDYGIGLFYASSKCLNVCLPPSRAKEFLEKFENGLKIDIYPLAQINSPSKQVEASISFSLRE